MELKELANEIHRPALKTFPTRKVYAKNVYEILSCDLVDLSFWQEQNNGYNFLLTIVDVLSKYAWAYPLKTKTAEDVTKAFEELFKQVHPAKVWCDSGGEFYNNKMKQLLKKNNVEMYSSYGNHKSAIVERFNRTLRGKMFKIFTEKNNRKWIHILQPLIKEYNNTRHSTIKMKPVQAIEPKNYDKLIENFNGKKISRYEPPKLKVGDHVRISRVKQLFEKGETAKWSLEVFKIREVIDSVPITYKISEWDNTPVEGNFYEQELQKTNLTDTFLVEKVLKKRKRKNINEVFVKWMGYNEKYNSWIKQSDVVGNFP